MSRLLTIFSFLLVLFFALTAAEAQQTGSANDGFGARAAKTPQQASDTGIIYDEYRLEKAAQDYYNSARFSGDNQGKTMHQIETESYNAIRQMENRASFKSQSSGAWQQIAGSQDGHASGRARGIAFDPTSKTVYVAAASGGIWKTSN